MDAVWAWVEPARETKTQLKYDVVKLPECFEEALVESSDARTEERFTVSDRVSKSPKSTGDAEANNILSDTLTSSQRKPSWI